MHADGLSNAPLLVAKAWRANSDSPSALEIVRCGKPHLHSLEMRERSPRHRLSEPVPSDWWTVSDTMRARADGRQGRRDELIRTWTDRIVHLHLTTLASWNVSAGEDCSQNPPAALCYPWLSHLASGAQPKPRRRRHGPMTAMRDSGVGWVPKKAGHIALNLKHGILWRWQGFVRHCTLKILGWSMACCAGPWTAKLEDCWAGRERLLDGEWPPYPVPGSGLNSH